MTIEAISKYLPIKAKFAPCIPIYAAQNLARTWPQGELGVLVQMAADAVGCEPMAAWECLLLDRAITDHGAGIRLIDGDLAFSAPGIHDGAAALFATHDQGGTEQLNDGLERLYDEAFEAVLVLARRQRKLKHELAEIDAGRSNPNWMGEFSKSMDAVIEAGKRWPHQDRARALCSEFRDLGVAVGTGPLEARKDVTMVGPNEWAVIESKLADAFEQHEKALRRQISLLIVGEGAVDAA